MNLRNQKRLAAELLKCGVNRVWIDPNRIEDVAEAITRSDVRSLIRAGAIKALRKKGISSGRAKLRRLKKKSGRYRGLGSRKGSVYARLGRKKRWIQRVRPLRRLLKELKQADKIDSRTYRKFYRYVKGGAFKSKAHLELHLKSLGLIREG